MKFGKEFAYQMVPEWQEAYMDYENLKKILKDIHQAKQTHRPTGLMRSFTHYRAYSGLIHPENHHNHNNNHIGHSTRDIESSILVNSVSRNGSRSYETTFLMALEEGGEFEEEFFTSLDFEFNKVNKFYKLKVQEVIADAVTLSKQMDTLLAFRIKVEKNRDPEPTTTTTTSASTQSPEVINIIIPRDASKPGPSGQGESNGEIQEVKEQESSISRVKPPPAEVLSNVKLNKTLETPASSIFKGVIDLNQPQVTFNKENLKKAESQLKKAFIEFYHKLQHLKSYSFLNILAFSKIMKKYEKNASRRASVSYMNMVDSSYLGSSDEVSKIMGRVETAFIEHFANSNRRKGMNMLRPKAKKEKHMISFTTGFSLGCAIALIVGLIALTQVRSLMDKPGKTQYMENMFPLYSFFAFIVLHMLMYAANMFFWRRYRINYSFIFNFKKGTELGYREIMFVSFTLAVLALSCVLLNLDMEMDPKTHDYKELTELLPLGLVLLCTITLICPLNIMYRSSRFFLLKSLFHCICAPFYKVSLQDFFLAEQLISQVQALRSLEFYICYYGWGDYKHRQNTCSEHAVYNAFYFIVAVVPYWVRLRQCFRRLIEEKDRIHGYNGLYYFLTIIAISTRTAYSLNEGLGWQVIAWIFSAIAALYGTYWDIVVDWGLLQRHSKNRWLRDKLVIPYKSVYFAAMVLNVLLRFAWLQTVLNLRLPVHRETLIAIFASLEIIRRGLWNFFRLENEHLNNVGKYRAFKSVPLPFRYHDNEDHDE